MNSEELKKKLGAVRFDQERYQELEGRKSELNLEESLELIIYRNIEIETRKSHENSLMQTQLRSKVNQLNELLTASKDQIAKLNKENERLALENKVNKSDLEDVREDVKKLDMLNVILKRKMQSQGNSQEAKIVQEADNQGGDSLVNSNFLELQNTCRKLSEKNEAGFSRLTYLSQVQLTRSVISGYNILF